MAIVKVRKVGFDVMRYINGYRISFNYSPSLVDLVKELPKRIYVASSREWEIPNDMLPRLKSLLEANCHSLVLDGFTLNDTVEVSNNSSSVVTDRERLDGIRPIVNFEFKTTPFNHQIEGFNMGLSKDKLLIADEQGLGKSKMSIDIAVARKNKDVELCLIICGVNSVKYNWEREISTHSNEEAYVIDGKSTEERVQQLYEWTEVGEPYFGIINIESLRKDEILETLEGAINEGIIGLVIVDEVHKAKNGTSQQGKALRKLNPSYRIGLTGTPIMNKAEDLWNVLHWLGGERRNFWAFRNNYCVMGGFGNKQVVGYKNLDELNANLNRVMLRRKKADVLDLPPKLHSVEYVELNSKHRTLYKQIEQGLIDEIDNILLNPSPLTSLLRLRQCTGGLLGTENPKLDRLEEIVAEVVDNNQKIIVFSQWESVASMLKSELRAYKPAYIVGEVGARDRQAEVDRFQNDDNCNLIIGTIGAMGTGLTLNKASYVVFMDKAWTPADNEQAEDRAHRIGTQGTVNIISLVAKDTIDERIESLLVEKRNLFEQVVEGRDLHTTDNRELIRELLGM